MEETMREFECRNLDFQRWTGNGDGHGYRNGRRTSNSRTSPPVIHLLNGDVIEIPLEPIAKTENAKRRKNPVVFTQRTLDKEMSVEFIEDPGDSSRIVFAVRRADHVDFLDHIDHHGQVLVPPAKDVYPFRSMHLPSGVLPFESARALASKCGEFLHKIHPLTDSEKRVLSSLVLNSWVFDLMPFALSPVILGPRDFTDILLRALALLCRCPVIVAGTTPSGLLRACTGVGATLLFECGNLPREVMAILAAGARSDSYFLRSWSAQTAFGLHMLASSEDLDSLESLPGGFAITLSLLEFPKWHALDDPQTLREGGELRNCLLGFRFASIDSLKIPDNAAEYAYSKRGIITGVLLAPFTDDVEYCSTLAEDLSDIDFCRVDRLPAGGIATTTAALRVAHDQEQVREGEMLMKELTEKVNGILGEMGESLRLTPKKVGAILSGLGFPKRTRRGRGYALELDREVLETIHREAKHFGVFEGNPYLPGGPTIECEFCRKYRLVPGVTAKGYSDFERSQRERQEEQAGIQRRAAPRFSKEELSRFGASTGVDEADGKAE